MLLTLRTTRRLTQIAFLGFVLWKAVGHQLQQSVAASLDALCPFGAVETAGRLVWAGRYLQKLNTSNVILGLGLLLSLALVGGVFCGWLCPLGSIQEWLAALRKRLRVPEVEVPRSWERWLGGLKYVVLAVVLWATWSTSKLVFADYDPYRTIFSLHWLFSPSEVKWTAGLTAGVVLAGSFLVPKFWCRFACPLGALVSLGNRVSFFRLQRTAKCTNCQRCNRVCPARLDVAGGHTAENCGRCLECAEACPVGAIVIEGPGSAGEDTRLVRVRGKEAGTDETC